MLEELEQALTRAVERVLRSVVSVRRAPGGGTGPEPFEGTGGSGFVLDDLGRTVTNEHVVGHARSVLVTGADGRPRRAEVLGTDPATDVAVVRAPPAGLEPADLGDSSQLRVGQFAVAVGNSLGLTGAPSVSVGVVSALHRPLAGGEYILEGLLQTDAAINPGNSGGPLADLRGRVIGMNTAVATGAQGVGFAVPVNTVRSIAEALGRDGRATRAWLGVSVALLPPSERSLGQVPAGDGVLVAALAPGGPAARAGVVPGDVLVRVGAQRVNSPRALIAELGRLPVGGSVDLTVRRAGRERKTVVQVLDRPSPEGS